MENKSYSYGAKLAGLILHLFFTVILTMTVFLLATMIEKRIFELTDIGTSDFLNSGYYTQCIQKKCDNLAEYLHLSLQGEALTTENNRRYLQYTDEFKPEDTNFCYWYKVGEAWYTNQPDMEEGQSFDPERVLMEAKSMGNYLIYDMINKEFGTDIRGLSTYFFESYNTQIYWPQENVMLIIGVDTKLSAEDDLYDASIEYQQLYPWIKVCLAGSLIALIGWILTLVYLILAAGHREEDNEIYLNHFDKIKTEFLIIGFVLIMSELLMMVARINSTELEASGLLVASGTVCLVTDALFLLFFLSIVRLMKAEKLWENSLAYWLGKGIRKTFRQRRITVKIMLMFLVHLLICFVLAMGAFYYRKLFCFILLMIFCGAECYMLLRMAVDRYQILAGVEKIRAGALDTKIETEELHGDDKLLAEAINNIGAGLVHAVDDNTKNERMKADLITNVSHDIKTPLTSIINYVNLIKREDIENERVKGYIKILDEKSQRLKQLTEDLVEASKVSSGNVKLDMQMIDLVELVYQTAGEFNEKFEQRELTIVTKLPREAVTIMADGRRLYRVIENLYNNVAKYAMQKTRVYVEVSSSDKKVTFSIKNVSEKALAIENSNAGDLTERFTRGDSSRTTEGSGLGLSIAKNLTQLMGGQFDINIDGDLFRAMLVFDEYQESEEVESEDIEESDDEA